MGIWRAHLERQSANEERSKNLTIMRDCGDKHILVQQFSAREVSCEERKNLRHAALIKFQGHITTPTGRLALRKCTPI